MTCLSVSLARSIPYIIPKQLENLFSARVGQALNLRPAITTAARVFAQTAVNAVKSVNLRALIDRPGQIAEGSVWAGFWGFSAYFAGRSLVDLYRTCVVEHPASAKFNKIITAVKTVLVDISSLVGGTGYMGRWAHEAKVIQLGQYAPLAKVVCHGGSLVANLLESAFDIYCIHLEKEAILNETSPVEREKHKKRLCWQLIKLIGHVAMVAWAALGIATVATGIAISSILMTSLLGISTLFACTAYFYQSHLQEISS